jgi:hypothetical protein
MAQELQDMVSVVDRLHLPPLPIEGCPLVSCGGFCLPAFGAVYDHEKAAIAQMAEHAEKSGEFAIAAITVILRSRYDATWDVAQSIGLDGPESLGVWMFYLAEREGLWQKARAVLS